MDGGDADLQGSNVCGGNGGSGEQFQLVHPGRELARKFTNAESCPANGLPGAFADGEDNFGPSRQLRQHDA